ncbi:SIS domain-containing protein [Microbacterium horticulturae]|uniref:SIS domain-containing protein n=1 Tax=Microbacterium horticulturae TaxID=3028316 RepID=A0ABY8BZ68_9MICO|nr:SIS domain-containing protein [Microbacterium sp. KACC 23027]WEG09494.1 SIS domain-containing protein [Microbacterium sp. KACC 23027]
MKTSTGGAALIAAPADAPYLLSQHIDDHAGVLSGLRAQIPLLVAWGSELAERLQAGSRLLVAGNGGSAAEAQHLTAELVGRFDGERAPFSAIALHADTSSLTAIGNDYGYEEVFARQVRAHARTDDILLLLSTSGRSPDLVAAARAGTAAGALVWAMTGSAPNPLTRLCHSTLALAGTGAAVQEAQLVAVHMLCRVFDDCVRQGEHP